MSSNPPLRDACILYAPEDKELILHKIIPAFRSRGIDYWIDFEQIDCDDGMTKKIEIGLRTSRYLVPCLSKSLGVSNWSRPEYNEVLGSEFIDASNKRLIPINLDNCGSEKMPLALRKLSIASYNDSDKFNKFLEFLKQRSSTFLNYDVQ
jgi:TIR domain